MAFSGGQRQAVAIGRAMYWNARLVIMDEPTAALGVPEQRKVISLIQSLKAQGKGIIFISHNLAVVNYLADRIAVMCAGRLVELASHDERLTGSCRTPVSGFSYAAPAAGN